jgi:hypothetical protein
VRAAAGDRRARFILSAIDDNGRGVPPASGRGGIGYGDAAMPAQLATVVAVEKRAERAYGTGCRDVTCAGRLDLYAALTTGAPVALVSTP